MAYYRNMTIRSIANSIALHQGYTLDDDSFKRYYRQVRRQPCGGNKYHMAYCIVELFLFNDDPPRNPPVPYNGTCTVRLINYEPNFIAKQQCIYKSKSKKQSCTA
ncbi:MAG: hypothetical protein HRU41_40570 [Saprospiraceae bacterium]|nr:hypothetical protein [Saprospiraceae bacterium]